MKTPIIKKRNIPDVINTAAQFPLNGELKITNNNLVYLDIDDAYIHLLFPLLPNQQIKKPDYFGEKSIGAHITVIYPEENKTIDKVDLGQKHDFMIKDIVSAQLGLKIYYVLLVD